MKPIRSAARGSKVSGFPQPLAIESTVRYLGVEVDDALEIAEKIEV